MKIISIFSRGLIQEWRDPLNLALTLFTTPFFIFFYWLFIGTASIEKVGLYFEIPDGLKHESHVLKKEITETLNQIQLTNKNLSIIEIHSIKDFQNQLKDGELSIGVLVKLEQTFQIEIFRTNASSKSDLLALKLKSELTDNLSFKNNPQIFIHPLADRIQSLNQFEQFVPGLLVFSLIMIIFSSSMMMTGEIESETYNRYKLSNTPIFVLLGGASLIQIVNGITSLTISLLLTKILGFSFQNNILWIFLICSIGLLACIGIGLIIASFMKTTQQAFLSSSFLMFLLLLFSGIIFPKPSFPLGSIDSYHIDLFDLLPTTLMKTALDKILVSNLSPIEIFRELSFLSALAIVYYLLGFISYRRLFRNLDK